MNTIIPERLAEITRLDEGGHSDFNNGVCAMEAAAYIVGEPWSDHPQCVCPVIATFMRLWNDALPDGKRTELLLPLIPATVGTRGSDEPANRRATMANDWLVCVHTPAWLRLAGLTGHADTLANLGGRRVAFAATLSDVDTETDLSQERDRAERLILSGNIGKRAIRCASCSWIPAAPRG